MPAPSRKPPGKPTTNRRRYALSSTVRGKSTRKGAYRGKNKAKMANRRRPFVETKRKDDEDVLAAGFFSGGGELGDMFPNRTNLEIYDTEHLMLDPYSYLLWSQGLGQSQHIGQAVNLKYTNMKIQVRFPQPSVEYYPGTGQSIPDQPMDYELIWGWVPAPLQFTGATTPAANVVTIDDIRNHINHRVTDYVNSKKDKLRFIPKKDVTIRIIGRKKVRPNLRFSTLAQDGTGSGTIPDYHTEISWKHKNRKIWLEQTGNINGAGDLVAMYPNYTWLPFCTFVNWNHDSLDVIEGYGRTAECPSVAWNSITYFSDS